MGTKRGRDIKQHKQKQAQSVGRSITVNDVD